MKKYIYSLDFKVRDYECDLQGVVNNAVYQHYLEHTRHEFLLSHGVSFADLHENGIDAVVVRVEIDFKTSLRSGDEFVSKLWVDKLGNLKLVFHQDIYRKSDNKLCINAKVYAVILENGKPRRPEEFVPQITSLIEKSK